MSSPSQRAEIQRKATVLEGAPRWITEQLLADTLQTWQPYYDHPLTLEDACEILLDVGRFFDVLENIDG